MTSMSASAVFALIDDWKNSYQRKLQRVKSILSTSKSRQYAATYCSLHKGKYLLGFVRNDADLRERLHPLMLGYAKCT